MATVVCPRCDKALSQAGELMVDGMATPVYQCDTCTQMVEMFGERVEVALTFVLGPDGNPLATDPDPFSVN